MSWHDLLPLLVFLVSLFASILSGLAGGGGGIIMTPFYILIGLSPQQSVATGKLGGFGLSIGAAAAFKKRMLEHRNLSIVVIALTTIIGLAASFFLQKVNNQSLQLLMGIFMLIMVPLTHVTSRGARKLGESNIEKGIGLILLTVILFLQAILAGGIGALTSVIFIIFFGFSALEANAMKRKISLILTGVVTVSLLNSGLINFTYAICGLAGGLVGGYIGSHIAIKKGDEFAKNALLIFMVVSGIWLIASA